MGWAGGGTRVHAHAHAHAPAALASLQDIECLASDGMLLVSCCLAGHVRVWDAQTGDCLTRIPQPG